MKGEHMTMRRLKPQILILMSLFAALCVPLRAQDAASLDDGQVGVEYNFPIPTTGGIPPLHWNVKSGALPPGLKLQDGAIRGTPTQAQASAYQFTLEVSDSSQPALNDSLRCSILVKAAPLRILLSAKPLRMVINASSSAQSTPAAGSPPARPEAATRREPATPNSLSGGEVSPVPQVVAAPEAVAPSPKAKAGNSPAAPADEAKGAAAIKPTCSKGDFKVLPPVYIGDQSSVTVCSDPMLPVYILVQGQRAGSAELQGEYVTPTPLDLTSVNSLQAQQKVGEAISTSSPLSLGIKVRAAKGDGSSPSSPCSRSGGSLLPQIVGSPQAGQGVQVVVCAVPHAQVKLVDENAKQIGELLELSGVFSATVKIGAYQAVVAQQILSDGTPRESAPVPPTAAPPSTPAAPSAQTPQAKTAPVACLTISPQWITIPRKPKSGPTSNPRLSSQYIVPIEISSCDSPALDLSKDEVVWLDSGDASEGIDKINHENTPLVCKSAATSELDCNLTVSSDAKRRRHLLQVMAGDKMVGRPLTLHIGDPDHYWIGMLGLDVTGSTGGPQQQWFAGADLMERIFRYDDHHPHGGLWAWTDLKLGSIPTAKTSALSSLGSASTVVSSSGFQSVGDITQSLELRGGLAPSLGNKTVSLLLGFGVVSPINPVNGAQEYGLSQNLYNQFVASAQPTSATSSTNLESLYPSLWGALNCSYASPAPSGCPATKATTVAFVLPSRSRFYRNYFAGFRLWFDPRNNGNSFPGRFDITAGQDETVTAARFHGVVLSLFGDYPIDSNGLVRAFGSVHMRIARNVNNVTLDMVPVANFVDPTTSTVVVQQTKPLDQDYFRIGLGFDISQAWSALTKAKSSASSSSATPKTAPAP
jgi:hypothetical protein